MQVSIECQAGTEGYVKHAVDARGQPYVVYDTRDAAAERLSILQKDVEAMLASLQIGQQRAGQAVPTPLPAVASVAAEDTYVRLVAAKVEADPGEFVEIKAAIENPKGDEGTLVYEWGGNHAGKGDAALFFASDLGQYTVTVTVIVRGSKGLVGSTSLDIRVR